LLLSFIYLYAYQFALHMRAFVTSRELLCEGSVNDGRPLDGWVSREPADRTHLLAPLSIARYAPGALRSDDENALIVVRSRCPMS
jgi:hypothetical protein